MRVTSYSLTGEWVQRGAGGGVHKEAGHVGGT
jgi:hypothetical protein